MASDAVRQIKERLSIVDVVGGYVVLHQAGKSFKGKSPFTNEKTPSFFVSPERGAYYCFSSSQGGDMFTFIQAMEGVDFKGALKILAERAGVELVPEDPKKRSFRERLYETLEAATVFFETKLKDTTEAKRYLKERGVESAEIIRWRLGYSPGPPSGGWRELRQALSSQGFTDPELKAAGLIKGGEEGKEPYDVFRDRVMFPIFDPAGRVVAFSGRILHPDEKAPKYVNSPETELFNKSETLYGYDRAKSAIRQLDFSLIVEGQFDVVLSHQAGYRNTVAVSGTSFTEHHASLLNRLSNRVVLALDADPAGLKASRRAAELLLSLGMDVKVAKLEAGADPADLVAKDLAAYKKNIANSVHIIDFQLAALKAEGGDERHYKLKVREEALPLLAIIPNAIDREHFVDRVAEAIKTKREAVLIELNRFLERQQSAERSYAGKAKSTGPISEVANVPKVSSRRRALFEYLLAVSLVIEGGLSVRLRETLVGLADELGLDLEEILTSPEVQRESFSFETELGEEGLTRPVKTALVERLNELMSLVKTERIERLRRRLAEAEAKENSDVINDSLRQITELQKEKLTQLFSVEWLDS